MTVGEVMDALDPEEFRLVVMRRIPHGTRLQYYPHAYVHVYHTGTVVVSGPDEARVRAVLDRAMRLAEASADKDRPRSRIVAVASVPSVKRVLANARHTILSERRLRDRSGTKLALEGGAVVVVYDSGKIVVQGKHSGWVQVLLSDAFPHHR